MLSIGEIQFSSRIQVRLILAQCALLLIHKRKEQLKDKIAAIHKSISVIGTLFLHAGLLETGKGPNI